MTAVITIDVQTALDAMLGKGVGALGAKVDPKTVDLIRERLATVVLPWRPDAAWPPRFERVMALGDTQVALVDSFLGGYGDAHNPRFFGWGYKAQFGSRCLRSVQKVSFKPTDSEQAIRASEKAARNEAMLKVDEFLRKEFPHLILLDEPLKEKE